MTQADSIAEEIQKASSAWKEGEGKGKKERRKNQPLYSLCSIKNSQKHFRAHLKGKKEKKREEKKGGKVT